MFMLRKCVLLNGYMIGVLFYRSFWLLTFCRNLQVIICPFACMYVVLRKWILMHLASDHVEVVGGASFT